MKKGFNIEDHIAYYAEMARKHPGAGWETHGEKCPCKGDFSMSPSYPAAPSEPNPPATIPHDRMHIPKLFYANPTTYPDWPYKDRRAIGYHLDKSYSRNHPVYRFEHAGILYEISRAKAQIVGRKFIVPGGVCPNLLPIAEMDRVMSLNHQQAPGLNSAKIL